MSTLSSSAAGPQAASFVPSNQSEPSRRRVQRWPLELLADRVADARELFTARANSTKFPVRAIRYWWAHCALLDEVRAQGRPITIADVGCSTGHLRRYTGRIDGAEWMGLDWKIEPSSNSMALSSCVLEMFPLCAIAISPLLHTTLMGCTFSTLLPPCVE